MTCSSLAGPPGPLPHPRPGSRLLRLGPAFGLALSLSGCPGPPVEQRNPDGATPLMDAASDAARDAASTPDLPQPPSDGAGDGAGAGDASAPVDLTSDLASDLASDLSGPPPADLSAPGMDLGAPQDAGTDAGLPPGCDGGFVPPRGPDTPLQHAPASPLPVRTLAGLDGITLDVGADRGGGIWAVTRERVYYWPRLDASPYTYDQAHDGLARGRQENEAHHPLESVAGGLAGQAIIGNRGAIADHLTVDPGSGRVIRIDNMTVDCTYLTPVVCLEHRAKVTATLRVIVDFDGGWDGTAYVGGTHGFSAWHGVNSDCGCLRFEEHQHFLPPSDPYCDSTGPQGGCWGGDTAGLALSPQGDVWVGDEHFVALLPQRSLTPPIDFFHPFKLSIDVFPGQNDEVKALATDDAGGVWVASFGEGLAYLAPETYTPCYYDRARELPQDRLTAVAVDDDGSVWVGTIGGGVARKKGSQWLYYTVASGLPGQEINAIFIDRAARGAAERRVLIAHEHGVSVYTGP